MIMHHKHELPGGVFWAGFWLTLGVACGINAVLAINAVSRVAADRLDRWWNTPAAISEPANPKALAAPTTNN